MDRVSLRLAGGALGLLGMQILLTACDRTPSAPSECATRLQSGDAHTCVVYASGRIWCFGANDRGQLGDGSTSPSGTLKEVPLTGVAKVGAGGDHTCASTNEGRLFCWGENASSESGITGVDRVLTPTEVVLPSGRPAFQLALGPGQTCLADTLLHLHCFGTDPKGSASPAPRFVQQIIRPVLHLNVGARTIRFVDENGRLFALSDWKSSESVVRGGEQNVIQNVVGSNRDCMLRLSGTVWCRGETPVDDYFVDADFGTEVVEIGVGAGFVCARTQAGSVLCHGANDRGQLGDGTSVSRLEAVTVAGFDDAVALSVGRAHTCVLRRDGSVWCWGDLPGGSATSRPIRFSQAADGAACAAAQPPDASLASRTPASILSDASKAYAQTQCRCGYGDAGVGSWAGCIRDETRHLPGCLDALATRADDAYLSCEAANMWKVAACWSSCNGDIERAGACQLLPPACPGTTAPMAGAAKYCAQKSLHCANEFVPASAVCDGHADCSNGFDEANCTAGQDTFHCADGSTVALAVLGDGRGDCADSSDEDWFPR